MSRQDAFLAFFFTVWSKKKVIDFFFPFYLMYQNGLPSSTHISTIFLPLDIHRTAFPHPLFPPPVVVVSLPFLPGQKPLSFLAFSPRRDGWTLLFGGQHNISRFASLRPSGRPKEHDLPFFFFFPEICPSPVFVFFLCDPHFFFPPLSRGP